MTDNKPLTVLELKIGSDGAIALSPDMLAHLKLKPGEDIYLAEIDGGYMLLREHPDYTRQMELGKQIVEEDEEVFRILADT